MTPVSVSRGDGPIVLGQPHVGTHVPPDLFERLNHNGQGLTDTDWHVDRLYDGLARDVTVVRASFHRYVIDANRDPSGSSLYPGQNTTTLCPQGDFDGRDIWQPGQAPSSGEIAARTAAFHAPYHRALSEEIARIKARHGLAILFDCHSIRSHIPFLFDGRLPVFNIGTSDSRTCDRAVESIVAEICHAAPGLDTVVNGRFKGGWTTRHHGRPENGVHAIQLELAQRAYMDETPPWNYRPERAEPLRIHLAEILGQLRDLALSGKLGNKGK